MKRKSVPDSWSSNTEVSSLSCVLVRGMNMSPRWAERRFARRESGGVDHCAADVFEVDDATDTVKCGSRNLELSK